MSAKRVECVQAGHFELLIGHLPAFPDNLDYVEETGTFWLGFVAKASKLIQMQLFRSRHIRAAAAYLPSSILSRVAPPVAGGMEFAADGTVVKVIVDATGKLAQSTPSGLLDNKRGRVVLGNLHHDYLTVVDLAS